MHITREDFLEQSPRRPNRTFRHQTNSFSFDDSVRASAAYEQDRISSTSTTDSVPRPRERINEHINLQQELRESYLINGRVSSAELSIATGTQEEHQNVINKSEPRRNHVFPSAELPMPPPFSTVSQNTSASGSLPSLHDQRPRNPSASSVEEASRSLPNQHRGRIASSSVINHRSVEYVDETALSPTVSSTIHELYQFANFDKPSGCPSSISLLSSAARVASSSRSRSPFGVPSLSPSSTPRRTQAGRSSRMPNAQTQSRSYHVYNDQLSPVIQPQTPAHLPESRHRSRFHPSYTAPVTRARPRFHSLGSVDGTSQGTPSHQPRPTSVTPSRRGTVGRSHSPVGLLSHGFKGLYGGRENGDEEQNWVDGVRFSSAEVNLWGAGDERDGRSLHETPERESWRIGRG